MNFQFSTFAKNITSHPRLIITKEDVIAIKENLYSYPVFRETFKRIKKKVDNAVLLPMEVPVPIDAAGYTHERHKQNYNEMMNAGVLYQISGEEKYAVFVKEMLLKYAELYPSLKQHPAAVSDAPGRLFWQSLNETVWLVNTIQAYDCIYDFLKPNERCNIEENVFKKMTEYFLKECSCVFNKIHNHGTWMTAAVGMTGFVLGDTELIEKSLKGSDKKGSGGFLKQLDNLFSPDGYYTEGAYYIRYTIQPFFLFAEAIENNLPDLEIYKYRNQILEKCFYSTLQLAYSNGDFIPINDAIKNKNYLSPEIIIALNLVYKRYGNNASLLGIAKKQNSVMLNDAGLLVAKDLMNKKELPCFNYESMELTDGKDGSEGGLALLRSGEPSEESLLVMKYTSHGLSHGHFDKLSFLYYDDGREILQDYGAARFVNIELKNGGRYLSENESFAKQSIAHNTITVDEESHYKGRLDISEKFHSEKHFFSCADPNFQIVSALDSNAYKGVKLQRTMAMIKDSKLTKPIIVDIFKVDSDEEHQYDLSFYYSGHFMDTNINYTAHDKVKTTMGNKNGYEHLWNEAEGTANGLFRVTWFTGSRYYTLTNNADNSTRIFFTRIGASDSNFNLRNEPGIILRKKCKSHVFASVIEPHGNYDSVNELSEGFEGQIRKVDIINSDENATVVQVNGKDELNWLLLINNSEPNENKEHSINVKGKNYIWKGNYHLIK